MDTPTTEQLRIEALQGAVEDGKVVWFVSPRSLPPPRDTGEMSRATDVAPPKQPKPSEPARDEP